MQRENGKETNEAWANATIDHWPHVGGDYDEPSADYLKKIISDMDRLPENVPRQERRNHDNKI